MPKSLIVYYSLGGTTAQVAENIAVGLISAGYQVDLCNLKDSQPPSVEGYDLLGIGAPVYYYRPPFNVMDYVQSLPDLKGLPTFTFMLNGTYRFDAARPLRRALADKEAQDVGGFHCLGADYFIAYLLEGYLFAPDSPGSQDLEQAERFGRQVATLSAGDQPNPLEDRSPPFLYRLARFLASRWLVNQVHTRLYRVSADRCTSCGICMRLCPTGNIIADDAGRPVWGRDCLGCLSCQMKCPTDAVSTPAQWRIFRPLVLYSIRRALRDPDIPSARVIHRKGSTKRVGELE